MSKWSLSGTGYSVKDEEGVIIFKFDSKCAGSLDGELFTAWLESAEHVCDLHNEWLEEMLECSVLNQGN